MARAGRGKGKGRDRGGRLTGDPCFLGFPARGLAKCGKTSKKVSEIRGEEKSREEATVEMMMLGSFFDGCSGVAMRDAMRQSLMLSELLAHARSSRGDFERKRKTRSDGGGDRFYLFGVAARMKGGRCSPLALVPLLWCPCFGPLSPCPASAQ